MTIAEKRAGALQVRLAAEGVQSKVSEIQKFKQAEFTSVQEWINGGARESKRPEVIRGWNREGHAFEDESAAEKPRGVITPVPYDLNQRQRAMLELDDDIIQQNDVVKKSHVEMVEAKETLAEVRKGYEAEQRKLSALVDELADIKSGRGRLPFPPADDRPPHPDVEDGKGRPQGTPAIEAMADGPRPGETLALDEPPTTEPDDGGPSAEDLNPMQEAFDAKRECCSCGAVYEWEESDDRGGCPACGATVYTSPDTGESLNIGKAR